VAVEIAYTIITWYGRLIIQAIVRGICIDAFVALDSCAPSRFNTPSFSIRFLVVPGMADSNFKQCPGSSVGRDGFLFKVKEKGTKCTFFPTSARPRMAGLGVKTLKKYRQGWRVTISNNAQVAQSGETELENVT